MCKRVIPTIIASVFLIVITFLIKVPSVFASVTFVSQWGTFGSGDSQFGSPVGIALDSSGNVYIADQGNGNRIQKFDSNGGFITKWGSSGAGSGTFGNLVGIAINQSTNNVYAIDQGNELIQEFSSTGTFIRQWGSLGTANGQFRSPSSITIDSSGNVYVGDRDNGTGLDRIQKFSSTGTYTTQWNFSATGHGGNVTPASLAVDSSDNIYVADQQNGLVYKYTNTGTFVSSFDGTHSGDITTVFGMAIDTGGDLYISDLNSPGGILKFNTSGTFVSKVIPSDTSQSFYLAVNNSGDLYDVTENNPGDYVILKFHDSGESSPSPSPSPSSSDSSSSPSPASPSNDPPAPPRYASVLSTTMGGLISGVDLKSFAMVGASKLLPAQTFFWLNPRTIADILGGNSVAGIGVPITSFIKNSSISPIYEFDPSNFITGVHLSTLSVPVTLVLPLNSTPKPQHIYFFAPRSKKWVLFPSPLVISFQNKTAAFTTIKAGLYVITK